MPALVTALDDRDRSVQTVQSLTHAAWIAFPERLRDGRLTDELTELILRYLAKD